MDSPVVATSSVSVPHRFYDALASHDWRAMGALYADDAVFNDPVFTNLNAEQVRGMWHMLMTRGKDLSIVYHVLKDTPTEAQVRWTATYTFSRTGRRVVNVITATLRLRDGKIVRHDDDFDFHRWARQALGVPGLLLGWSDGFRAKVQAGAMSGLADFMKKVKAGPSAS